MSKEFESLLERYWDLAYLEGKAGISQGDKANEVLHALRAVAEQPAQQEPDDSLLLCASDLEHSAIYDNHAEMQSCIRAVASRIKAFANTQAREPAIPQGWKLVPVEPTPKQIKEGNKVTWPFPCSQVYSHMLNAAPTPQQGE